MYDDESEEALSFEDDDEDDQMGEESGAESLETRYYYAKSLKDDGNHQDALAAFANIVSCQQEDPDNFVWKSIKQSIKICIKSGQFGSVSPLFDTLLDHFRFIDDRSYAYSGIYKLILKVERFPLQYQREIYSKLTSWVQSQPVTNDIKRIKIKIDLSYVNILINENQLSKALAILRSLEQDSLQGPTHMLDIIVNELLILMKFETLDLKEIERLIDMSKKYMTGIPHAKVIGIINECMGIISMYKRDFPQADDHFRISFKGFNDIGDDRKFDVMPKYVISSLLSRSHINPFESNDFHGLLNLDITKRLTKLYYAVQNKSIVEFQLECERLVKDQFLRDFIPLLLELIKFNYILDILPLMSKISFSFLAKKLNTDDEDIMKIIFKLYNRGHLKDFKIDFTQRYIENDVGPIIKDISPYKFIANITLLKSISLDEKNKLTILVKKLLAAKSNGQQPDSKEDIPLDTPQVKVILEEAINETFLSFFIDKKALLECIDSFGYLPPAKWYITSPRELIDFYLKTLVESLPEFKEIEKNRIEKSNIERINQDNKKIFTNTSIKERFFDLDTLLPQIVQFSEMNSIEPPNNPIPKPMTYEEQISTKLTKLDHLSSLIDQYQFITKLKNHGATFNGNKLTLGKTTMHQPLLSDVINVKSPLLDRMRSLQPSEVSSQTSEDDQDDDDDNDLDDDVIEEDVGEDNEDDEDYIEDDDDLIM